MYSFSKKLKISAIVFMILGALGIAYGFLTIPNSIEEVKQLTEQQNQGHNEANAANVIEQNPNHAVENG